MDKWINIRHKVIQTIKMKIKDKKTLVIYSKVI
jgi:hypothetical protein